MATSTQGGIGGRFRWTLSAFVDQHWFYLANAAGCSCVENFRLKLQKEWIRDGWILVCKENKS